MDTYVCVCTYICAPDTTSTHPSVTYRTKAFMLSVKSDACSHFAAQSSLLAFPLQVLDQPPSDGLTWLLDGHRAHDEVVVRESDGSLLHGVSPLEVI